MTFVGISAYNLYTILLYSFFQAGCKQQGIRPGTTQ